MKTHNHKIKINIVYTGFTWSVWYFIPFYIPHRIDYTEIVNYENVLERINSYVKKSNELHHGPY